MTKIVPIDDLRPADPRRLGQWVLLGRLGAGGMGVVFLGRSGERIAAVKTIAVHLGDAPEFRARFRREVAVCGLVTGDQVAELYDADTEAEIPWLAVRYIPGPTLEQVVRANGPLTADAALAFAVASLEALRQIHDKGVTHRDLKPANIILTPKTPVLIDFGIARHVEGTAITATQTTIGSAGWMAPEVLTEGNAGPAADLFAWGAVVAYAATGVPPYGTGPAEGIAYRVVHQEPDLARVPPDLQDVVRTALTRDPLRRPDLATLMAGLTGETDPTSLTRVITSTITESWPMVAQGIQSIANPPEPIAGRRLQARTGFLLLAATVALAIGSAALLDVGPFQPPSTPATSSSATSSPTETRTTAAQAPSVTSTTPVTDPASDLPNYTATRTSSWTASVPR